MKHLFLILFTTLGLRVAAQDVKFTAILSKSTVALDSKFKVEFKLENAQGTQFQAPEFEDFEVVAGPSTSSSMSIINGEVTQSIAYVYYLRPKEVGTFTLDAASITVKGEELKTKKMKVKVVEKNEVSEEQEEEITNDPFANFFRTPPSQPKKVEKPKRKRNNYQL
jgi:hypothetical protein